MGLCLEIEETVALIYQVNVEIGAISGVKITLGTLHSALQVYVHIK